MNYTLRFTALMAAIAIGTYSCAWYHVESEKQTTAQMKDCIDSGHLWKEGRIRGWHWCE